MAHQFKGEVEIEIGLGLPVVTTAFRTSYTPPRVGYKVYDTDLGVEFVWDGVEWLGSASAAAVEALKSRVTTNESDIATAESNIDSLFPRIGTAEADINNLETNLSNLTVRVDTAEGEIDTLQSDATALTGRVTTAESDIAVLDAEKLDLAGGIMSGDIAMGENEITGLPATPSATSATSKEYVDAQVAAATQAATDSQAALSTDDLTDVDTSTTAPVSGDALVFDGTNFVPGRAGATQLDELDDVDTTTTAPVAGDALFFDGTNFVNRATTKADVSDFTEADYVHATGDETIAGVKTFTSSIVLPGAPTTDLQAATKAYVDDEVAAITASQGALTTDDLTDVDTSTTAPATGHALVFDGTNFVNRDLVTADISDAAAELATAAQGVLADTAVQPGDATSTLTNNDAFVDLTTAQTIAGEKTFSDDIQANGNVTVAGDLVVNGTTTTVNSTNTEIADSIITLNAGETGAGVTSPNQSGLEIKRGTETDAFMIWSEANDAFGLAFEDGATEGVVDVTTFKAFALAEDVAATSYQTTFDTGDWTTGSPNTFVVTQATHGIAYSANEVFIVQVYEADGSLVSIDTKVNQTTGDVTVSTVGATFAGRVIISK